MKHFPLFKVIGLGDPHSPYLTLRQSCICGELLSERTWDTRLGQRPDLTAAGAADVDAFIRHIEEAPA